MKPLTRAPHRFIPTCSMNQGWWDLYYSFVTCCAASTAPVRLGGTLREDLDRSRRYVAGGQYEPPYTRPNKDWP